MFCYVKQRDTAQWPELGASSSKDQPPLLEIEFLAVTMKMSCKTRVEFVGIRLLKGGLYCIL
jgi:hypothetical protein